MPAYKAPLREIKFILNELLHAENMPQQVPDFSEATPDTVEAILEEAVKRMVPRNKLGRQQMKKLKIYATPKNPKDPTHPHQAQQPIVFKMPT